MIKDRHDHQNTEVSDDDSIFVSAFVRVVQLDTAGSGSLS